MTRKTLFFGVALLASSVANVACSRQEAVLQPLPPAPAPVQRFALFQGSWEENALLNKSIEAEKKSGVLRIDTGTGRTWILVDTWTVEQGRKMVWTEIIQ